MKNFTLITALSLCSFSWISVSVSVSQTVEVQPGQDAILQSDKLVKNETATFWFRLVDRDNPSCIFVLDSDFVEYCAGIQKEKFNMSSNASTVSLTIKQVNFSDSGLYFCGFDTSRGPTFSVIHLKVEGSDEPHDDVDNKCTKETDGITKLTSLILGTLTVLLVMVIIVLFVKNRKLQSADREEHNPEQRENVGSDDLNYAAVTFPSKAKRKDPEPNVVYTATR